MKRTLLYIVALSSILTTADARQGPPNPVESRQASLPFRLEVGVRFPGGQKALDLRARGKLKEALSALETASGKVAGIDAARRRALKADLQLALKDYPAALASLEGLETLLPELTDHLLFMRGKAHLAANQLEEAIAAFKAIPSDSPLSPIAAQRLARAELNRNAPQAALEHLDALVAGKRVDELSPETLWLMGNALTLAGGRDADAAVYYRALSIYAPLSSQAGKVAEGLKQLEGRGVKPPPLSLAERLTQANVYFAANLNEAAVQRLKPVLTELRTAQSASNTAPLSAEAAAMVCGAAFNLGVAYQNQRMYSDAAPPLTIASEVCETDLKVKAIYRLARGEINKSSIESASKRARELAATFPQHSIADDTLFIVGAALQDDGRLLEASQLFEEQIKTFPAGDMRAEASWRLAWISFRNNDLETAIERLEASLIGSRFVGAVAPWPETLADGSAPPITGVGTPADRPPPSFTPPGGGFADNPKLAREAYWRARWLELAGKRSRAEDAYERLIQLAPTDYYAVLAMSRLKALAPARTRAMNVSALVLHAPGSRGRELDISIQPLPIQRAIPLLRAGLQEQAFEELMPLFQQANFPQPLLLGYLFEQAARFDLSHRILKRVLEDNALLEPSTLNRGYFFYAFPMAYPGYMEQATSPLDLDALLLTALSREESTFDPDIRSWAGATGLTQLMEPTAARMAKALKLPVPTKEDLTDPALNLKLGAYYLSQLLRLFDGHVGLAVPSYNAGEAAVQKWVKLRNSLPFDEFVEEIPYKQTRDYVKRVLSTYQTYHYLYRPQAAFIEVPWKLPTSR